MIRSHDATSSVESTAPHRSRDKPMILATARRRGGMLGLHYGSDIIAGSPSFDSGPWKNNNAVGTEEHTVDDILYDHASYSV
jgi:hypothetical protein